MSVFTLRQLTLNPSRNGWVGIGFSFQLEVGWPRWVSGFLALDTELHCRAVMPRFSGGVPWRVGGNTYPLNKPDVVLPQF